MLNVDSAVAGLSCHARAECPRSRDLVLRRGRVRHGRPLGPEPCGAALDRGTAHSLGRQRAAASSTTRSGSAAALGARSIHAPGFVPQMGWLGSGSDYTVFVDHLGIPAVDVGFKGGYGVYHSIYDDFNWMEKFGDPEFLTHATAARLYTLIAMRAAAADVVPLRFVPYGQALREHVDDLRLIHARRIRQDDASTDKPPREIEGLGDLVQAVAGLPGSCRGVRPGHRGPDPTRRPSRPTTWPRSTTPS